MFAAFRKHLKHRGDGFTLIEISIVVAILGILIALAVPRYMASRKKGYKAEGQDLLQEAKTLQWAYYQQYNFFDTTANMVSIGYAMPGGSHWSPPNVTGTGSSIQILVSGAASPLVATDSIWITLSGDGTSSGGATF